MAVNGVHSEEQQFTGEMPQGAVLGIHFIKCFMSDITDGSEAKTWH